MPVKLSHISYYLPKNTFTNDDFFALFPEAKENVNLLKTGVKQRVISDPDETAGDMAVKAAQNFFNELGIKPSEIDFLVYASTHLDHRYPATSCIIHNKLGLEYTCGAIDVSHGCSAYVYALSVARGMIESNNVKNVLMLTAYTISKDIHPKDKASRFVFGDGAAATFLEPCTTGGMGNPVFATDSAGWQKIIFRDGEYRNPVNDDSFKEIKDEFGNITTTGTFFMDGVGVFFFSLKRVPELVKETLRRNNLEQNDIDLFIFHQANLYMIETIVKKLGIPTEKVFNNIENIGNTVGATIPIAIAQAKAAGRLQPGNKVMLVGFGVGLSLSAIVVQF